MAGIAHPRLTRGGKYSKYLPTGLLQTFEELVSDDELLSGMDDLRLLYARLTSLLQSNNSGDLYEQLTQAWAEFEAASRLPDNNAIKKEAMAQALTEVNALIRRGKAESGRWFEIYSLSDRLVRMRESERRRLLDEQEALTSDKAMLFVTALMDSVRRRVTDGVEPETARRILAGISADLVGLIGSTRGRIVGAGTADEQKPVGGVPGTSG